jgi:hypothetical protein
VGGCNIPAASQIPGLHGVAAESWTSHRAQQDRAHVLPASLHLQSHPQTRTTLSPRPGWQCELLSLPSGGPPVSRDLLPLEAQLGTPRQDHGKPCLHLPEGASGAGQLSVRPQHGQLAAHIQHDLPAGPELCMPTVVQRRGQGTKEAGPTPAKSPKQGSKTGNWGVSHGTPGGTSSHHTHATDVSLP